MVDLLRVFLQRVPKGVNVPLLRQKILCLDGVERVKHFHIWALTSKKKVVTVHVKIKDMGLADQKALKERISEIFQDMDTELITIDLEDYTSYVAALFEDHQPRLNVLGDLTRSMALRYAEEIYSEKNCSKEEALERGVTKAEMELKNL